VVRSIEELSLNAWPALETMVYDGWLLRVANGYTKRANSVNPIYESQIDLDKKVSECERVYARKNLPTIFKMTPCSCPEFLDGVLEQQGYASIGHSSVQVLELSGVKEPSTETIRVDERITDKWLDNFCHIAGLSETHKNTAKMMLSTLVPQSCFMSLLHEGKAIAFGLGVLERGFLGLYDIATAPDYRGRGFGEQLVLNLLQWGKANGAAQSYLQVMLDNEPALKLYAKLGFQEAYRYWYRIKETRL